MSPLTEKQIRDSFVNATKREIAQATLPDLAEVAWERLDYLGWRDRKAPLAAYVTVWCDGEPVSVLLRAPSAGADRRRSKGVCAWCEDVVVTDDVSLYAARRAGAAGRKGDTIGTLVCTEFGCSRNVRRKPTYTEAGNDPAVHEVFTELRIAGLQERSQRFAREVLRTR
ncbi:FBP domain-containing protein [Xylanimonas sp. McL0601]|uniref:FBP domain-containing protein n=1 Tax=Xylanimonas sp. McL0601 TaxID=3414739 RepID=UPI003CF9748E